MNILTIRLLAILSMAILLRIRGNGMSITRILLIIVTFTILFIMLSAVILENWIKDDWFSLILIILISAIFLSFVFGFSIEYVYRKFFHHSRFSLTTRLKKPRKKLAKLILPGDNELIIDYHERVYGREDFVGILVIDKLLFIGKEHFKITHLDDGIYIEDLNTKNGTKVNGEEIKGLGKIKLKNNDSLLFAGVLEAKYLA